MIRKTPAERLLMGFDMSATTRAMVWSTLPSDLPEDEGRRAFYLRYYGEPLPWKMDRPFQETFKPLI